MKYVDIILILGYMYIFYMIYISKKKNDVVKEKGENKDRENIKKLIRQTARWATAAEQDINPYIANLHATYALGYLMALKEIYNENEILKHSNVDIRRLESEITIVMDNAISKLVKICPKGQPINEYLAYLSKEGSEIIKI